MELLAESVEPALELYDVVTSAADLLVDLVSSGGRQEPVDEAEVGEGVLPAVAPEACGAERVLLLSLAVGGSPAPDSSAWGAHR